MGTRVGIVGSRHFPSREVVRSFIKSMPQDIVIVSGGAEGVDAWSVEIGNELGMETIVLQADWQRHGRKAGPMRNAEIVKNVAEVVAFWDGRSRGTLNTIVQATNSGVPVRVIDQSGNTLPTEWVLDQAKQLGVTAGIEKARA